MPVARREVHLETEIVHVETDKVHEENIGRKINAFIYRI